MSEQFVEQKASGEQRCQSGRVHRHARCCPSILFLSSPGIVRCVLIPRRVPEALNHQGTLVARVERRSSAVVHQIEWTERGNPVELQRSVNKRGLFFSQSYSENLSRRALPTRQSFRLSPSLEMRFGSPSCQSHNCQLRTVFFMFTVFFIMLRKFFIMLRKFFIMLRIST